MGKNILNNYATKTAFSKHIEYRQSAVIEFSCTLEDSIFTLASNREV